MNKFSTVPLEHVAHMLSGGTPSKAEPSFWQGHIPWLTPKDMGHWDGSTEETVSDAAIGNGTRLAPEGTIFIAVRGMSLHNEIRIVRSNTPLTFNQDIKAIVPSDGIDGCFLYYALLAKKAELLDCVESAGHGTGRLPTDRLQSIAIPDIARVDQEAVAHLLGALDDKINVNSRMSETLEAMAQTIFKDWFVEFGPTRTKKEGHEPYLAPIFWTLFPSRFDNEGKPEGWESATVKSIAERVAMGPFGSNIKVETFVENGIPIISGRHLNGTMLEDSEFNFISEEHAQKLANSNVGRGDIVFTHAGNIGQVSIIPETSRYERYVLSQRQFYLRCNRQRVSPLFMTYFFRSNEGQHKLLANTSQVGVPSIAQPATNLKAIDFCLPPKGLMDAFDEIVRVAHLKIGSARQESEVLSSLRDYLLPRLMSGEIRLKDAEKKIEEPL